MPELHFTEDDIKEAKVGRTQVLGTELLYVVKTPKGVVRYEYRYRVPRNVERDCRTRVTAVGKPGISLNKAKDIAAKYQEWLKDGIDPQDAKKWKHRDEMTFGKLADEYIEANKHRWGEKRFSEADLFLHKYGVKLTKLRMAQCQIEVIRDAYKPLLERVPRQARRALT
ncbi:MAG TPA: Arm DNA-binding domain-containing protein, partial [Xanthobacteraceae bacterium]|nr:Arm DNA-binding domain-containing protein [Xanthobacteraceae bacterium]